MTEPPVVGAFVVDTRDDRLARVHAVRNRRLHLWARVAAENGRSRDGRCV